MPTSDLKIENYKIADINLADFGRKEIKLAEEEKKHSEVLHNILDYILEPKNFVTAAEF